MINYIYDGTFEGLLTLIAGVVESNEEIAIISTGAASQPDLFNEVKEVPTDPSLAAQFFKRLATKLSRSVLVNIAYCFFSEAAGIEKVILDYIRLLITKDEKVAGDFSNPAVFKILRTSDKVNHEIGRMHGFIRFRKLNNGIYYAPIEPDHNIVRFLAPYFTARFADQQWLIHDVKRRAGIFYNGNRCRFLSDLELLSQIISSRYFFLMERQSVIDSQDTTLNQYSSDKRGMGLTEFLFNQVEMDYQQLWDQYFQNIAIAERRNQKLQKQRMPIRYWRYLVEKVEY